MKGNRKVYTDEQRQWIKDNIVGHSYKETVEAFNKKFNENLTLKKLYSFCGSNKLHNGVNALFKKGHSPWSKGLNLKVSRPDMYEKLKNAGTWFKKGCVPANQRNQGDIYISKDGRKYIKHGYRPITKNSNTRANWKPLQAYIWEQAHGTLPKNYAVIFLDGDKDNFNLNNLAAVPVKVLLRANTDKNLYKNAELTKTGLLISTLNTKISDLKKIKNEKR